MNVLQDRRFIYSIIAYVFIVLSWYSLHTTNKLQSQVDSLTIENSVLTELNSDYSEQLDQYQQYSAMLKDLARHTN